MTKIFILPLILIGTFLTATAALAQKRPYDELMKDIQAAFTSLKKNLDANAGAAPESAKLTANAAAADAATKLETLFKEVEAFWAQFDTQDAMGYAKGAGDAAQAVGKAAKINDIKAAQNSYVELGKQCANCHLAHRDGTDTRIKP